MSRFLRKKLNKLEAYTPGEQPQDGVYIKLNTNENPFPPSPKVMEAVRKEGEYRKYPDPSCSKAVKAVAEYYGLGEEQVVLGNGSDELLAFAFMAYGEKVYYPELSYGFYPVFKQVFDCKGGGIPLRKDFSIAPEDYYGLDGTIVIANPNAPTGLALETEQIEKILTENPNQVVIIDEAYVDFGADSMAGFIDKYENLLVIQTMSKSRGLAGMRIGMALGNAELIADLNRIRFSFNPYNLSREALVAAKAAIEDREYFEKTTGEIKDNREFLQKGLEGLGIEFLRSKANFVFAKTGRGSYEKLKEKKILVRYFDKEPIQEYVRITIGTREEMEKLLEALEEINEEK